MQLDIRHLKLMVAVTEEKTVTKAGARLHLTQSALSHQLRELEARIGTPLFLRINKKMILTQAGERVLHSAHQILAELKHIEADLQQMTAHDRGTLRLSTECYTCYHWLPEIMREFCVKYPQVEVKIAVETTHEPLPALLNGKLDLAIVSSAERHKQCQYYPLFKDELVAIMPPQHPLAKRAYLRPRDFADQHLILYVPPKDSDLYNLVLNAAGVKPARLTVMQLTEAIIEMVKADLGISVLARWAVQEQIAAGKLIARPVTKKGLFRQWNAAVLRNDFIPQYLKDFIALLSRPTMPLVKSDTVRFAARPK